MQETLHKIENDFRNFLDKHYLKRDAYPEFHQHYFRSAILAAAIGSLTSEFKSPAKNLILWDATLYCDVGLDDSVKLGETLDPDLKEQRLHHHIDASMDILRGGDYFFKHAILLIAWHHWQPDDQGYTPLKLPALDLYKSGGNIIALSTAFDSILFRNFKKYHDLNYAITVALTIIKKNSRSQFVELYVDLLDKALESGLTLSFNHRKTVIKTTHAIKNHVILFLKNGIYSYDDFKSIQDAPRTKSKTETELETFERTMARGINGELYNVPEIIDHLTTLIKILSRFPAMFAILYIKILEFMSCFHYNDGIIKGFIVDNFYRIMDDYCRDLKMEPPYQPLMNSLLDIWRRDLKRELSKPDALLLEKNIDLFLTCLKYFCERYKWRPLYRDKETDELMVVREEEYIRQIKGIYVAKEIDLLKSKINRLKIFKAIWKGL